MHNNNFKRNSLNILLFLPFLFSLSLSLFFSFCLLADHISISGKSLRKGWRDVETVSRLDWWQGWLQKELIRVLIIMFLYMGASCEFTIESPIHSLNW